MTTEGKDRTGGMDPGDDAALWSLLGRQEMPVKVSPYFARRVLREIALDERQPRNDWFGRLRGFWSVLPRHTAVWSGALAFGMLCLSAVLTIPANHPRVVVRSAEAISGADVGETLASTQETVAQARTAPIQDDEVIADLDTVLSREESRLWTEDTDTGRF